MGRGGGRASARDLQPAAARPSRASPVQPGIRLGGRQHGRPGYVSGSARITTGVAIRPRAAEGEREQGSTSRRHQRPGDRRPLPRLRSLRAADGPVPALRRGAGGRRCSGAGPGGGRSVPRLRRRPPRGRGRHGRGLPGPPGRLPEPAARDQAHPARAVRERGAQGALRSGAGGDGGHRQGAGRGPGARRGPGGGRSAVPGDGLGGGALARGGAGGSGVPASPTTPTCRRSW